MKITPEYAQKFIEAQQAGDIIAIEGIEKDIENDASPFSPIDLRYSDERKDVYFYARAMEYLNCVIIRMETGKQPFDIKVDELYRNGMGILLEKCQEALSDKEEI